MVRVVDHGCMWVWVVGGRVLEIKERNWEKHEDWEENGKERHF